MLETLSGTVENIVFHSEESGYTVCAIRLATAPISDTSTVTIVGKCATIWVGEELTADGHWVENSQFGRQFAAETITCIAPSSTEGIRRYLSSGLIRGIGKVTANRIVDMFGADTLDMLDHHPEKLCNIPKIGSKKQTQIKTAWAEGRTIRTIMIVLQSNGIGIGMASRIYRRYGADAIAIVKSNPYRLAEDVHGIGFQTADNIALNNGIAKDSAIRAEAGLLHCLKTAATEEGHCYTTESELLLVAQDMLDISVETLAEALNVDITREVLVRVENRIYLREYYDHEVVIARKLLRIAQTPIPFKPIPLDKALPWAEKEMGITFAAAQWDALGKAISSKVTIITGGPGVGKTTIIKALCLLLAIRKLRVFLAAPTGRAAKRMTESTGRQATTLHRLLKYQPATHSFYYKADNPIEGDCFIVDEASMFDIVLMRQFLEALPSKAMLIVVGDTDQLPSVGPGSVLKDLIDSRIFACTRLNAIYRQDTGGYIVKNAHHINRGEPFSLPQPGEKSDFYFIETVDPEKVITRTIDLMTRRIPMEFKLDPFYDIQILTPMRRALLGTENINARVQAAINPHGPAIRHATTLFREKDRVMQIVNNYDKDIFNGDIGFVSMVDTEDNSLVVLFDGRPVTYTYDELNEIILAYACSIHKSQGSEYPAVIILLHTQHFKLLQRNLIYTAMTRGKKLVCIIGSSKALYIARNNNTVSSRRTTLATMLQNNHNIVQ